MGLFEDNVFEHGDGVDVLLLDRTVIHLLLANNHASGLGLEKDATGGDGLGTAVLEFDDADRREANLEDSDAIELDLLAEFEEVFEGFAELLEDGLDIGLSPSPCWWAIRRTLQNSGPACRNPRPSQAQG